MFAPILAFSPFQFSSYEPVREILKQSDRRVMRPIVTLRVAKSCYFPIDSRKYHSKIVVRSIRDFSFEFLYCTYR